MGSPALQGGCKNSNLSFHKWERERFSVLSHLVADEVPRQGTQLHFFYPRNDYCTAWMPRSRFLLGFACFLKLVFILPDLPWLSGSCYSFFLLLLVNSGPHWGYGGVAFLWAGIWEIFQYWSGPAPCRDGICIPLLINLFFFCIYY